MSLFDFKSAEDFKEQCGYTIDDIWYPRVTKIVGIKAKPALLFYYAEAKSYAEANAQTKKSAEEGTAIHNACEKIFVGENPVVEAQIAPAITAFQEFMSHKNIQVAPDFIERRIVSFDHRYAGTMDALALIDGKLGVLDIKTSQAIYRDYNLQTSAYMDALHRELKTPPQTRWILRIDQAKACLTCGASLRTKGGKEKIRTAKYRGASCPEGQHEWSETRGIIELKEFPYWKEDFDAFLGAKKLWEWENDSWLRKVGYLK